MFLTFFFVDDDEDEINHAKNLIVPDGGYDEDEDCINAEDEEYRKVIDQMDKEQKVKRELYLAGEPVYDDDEDDFDYVSNIDSIDLNQYFLTCLNMMKGRGC